MQIGNYGRDKLKNKAGTKRGVVALRAKTLLLVFFVSAFLISETSAYEEGWASWFSNKETLNRKCADGQYHDLSNELVCASWDYDIGSKLSVQSVATGKMVVVRVVDRGPNRRLNRKIDLSKYAFEKICDTREGLCRVVIRPF